MLGVKSTSTRAYLIDHRLMFSNLEKLFQILRTEVGNAYRLELALILHLLKDLPCGNDTVWRAGERVVDEVEVRSASKLLERRLDGSSNPLIGGFWLEYL